MKYNTNPKSCVCVVISITSVKRDIHIVGQFFKRKVNNTTKKNPALIDF